MSRITFHHQNANPVHVSGAERTYAHDAAVTATLRTLGADTTANVFALVSQGTLPTEALSSTTFGKTPQKAIRDWLRNLMGYHQVTINREPVNVTHAVLNTAAVAGPDAVAFLARLHGSVEDCLWIDTTDVPWFTTVLTTGLTEGTLRTDMGWETAIDHITAADGPIVISSSQGRNFPDENYDDLTGEPIAEKDPWGNSLTRLKERGWWLQLTPDNLRQPAYSPLLGFHDLAAVSV